MYDRKSFVRAAWAVFFGLAMASAPGLVSAKSVAVHKAKISLSHARKIALKAYPGKIMKEELEHERGGSGLRYSFDMRRGKHWREVGVDAMTGHVLENSRERANPRD